MGTAAKRIKERTCYECGQSLLLTAVELAEHVQICKRCAALGIEMPNIRKMLMEGLNRA